jgi:hypothetical protein
MANRASSDDLVYKHISHSNVWQPRHDRDFLLEPKPDDGPPGTMTFDSEQVWKYFLDFESPIPDDLFLPLK